MSQYTDAKFEDRDNISVAPDTHVLKASRELGLITDEEFLASDVQEIVAARWQEVFDGTTYDVIDIHTPLWLWSRGGFTIIK